MSEETFASKNIYNNDELKNKSNRVTYRLIAEI